MENIFNKINPTDDDIDLNVISFNPNIIQNKYQLCELAFIIFDTNIDLVKIKISKSSLKKFINIISKYYHNNYYHNFAHALMVLQFVHLIFQKINIKKKISELEIFGILLSALVHDLDHPAHTNSFEINIKSDIALKYNNQSVLENHHLFLALNLINSFDIDLFKNSHFDEKKIINTIITECILGTDMISHNKLVQELKNKIDKSINFTDLINLKDFQDMLFFSKIIIHLADISNQLRPFDICFTCSNNLRKEFKSQVKKERKLGLPVQDYMDLDTDKKFYLAELYFSSQMVKPLWESFLIIFPELICYSSELDKNIEMWKKMICSCI